MSNIDKQSKYKEKHSRLWERFDEACHGNADQMREILELTLDALEKAEVYIVRMEREGTDAVIELSRIIQRELNLKREAENRITDGENRIRKQNRHVCELFDDNAALRLRISELELAQSFYDEGASMLCGQYDELAAAMGWTSELAEKQGVSQLEYARQLNSRAKYADKLQDSAFRHGLQHGFSFGQTDNQAGFEECLLAYSQKEKSNG